MRDALLTAPFPMLLPPEVVGGCVSVLNPPVCSSGSRCGLAELTAKILASRPDVATQRRARVYGRLQRYCKCGAV